MPKCRTTAGVGSWFHRYLSEEIGISDPRLLIVCVGDGYVIRER